MKIFNLIRRSKALSNFISSRSPIPFGIALFLFCAVAAPGVAVEAQRLRSAPEASSPKAETVLSKSDDASKIVFEGKVVRIGKPPTVLCGVIAPYRLAEYHVERVYEGHYDKSKIVVDHLFCSQDLLGDLKPGDKVMVEVDVRKRIPERSNDGEIRRDSDVIDTFYVGADVLRFVGTSETKNKTKEREKSQESRLVTFLKSNPELLKSFTSRFKGAFREIPAELRAELKQRFPQFQFFIAEMEVYLDPPAKEYDLIVVADADTQEARAFVWARYWTLPSSSSFERILEGRQAHSKDEALAQVRVLAKLITYATNDQVGKAAVRKGKLTVELIRGDGVFRVLTAQLDKHLRFRRLSITTPREKSAALYLKKNLPKERQLKRPTFVSGLLAARSF